MRRILLAAAMLFVTGASLPRAADLNPLFGACALPDDALLEKVATALSRRPEAVATVAELARGCSCERAATIARGVMRAVKQLQASRPEAIQPMYTALTGCCGPCLAAPRPPGVNGPAVDAIGDERCERAEFQQESREADALKVRAPPSKDCFCSTVASLAAQNFAGLGGAGARAGGRDGDAIAAQRFGFFPDEGAFSGGGAGGDGAPISSQTVTGN